ncbi:hypothetical protein [Leucobacter iarius]
MEQDDETTSGVLPGRKGSPRPWRRRTFIVLAVLGALVLVTMALPVANPLFPKREQASCTVESSSKVGSTRAARRGNFFPRVGIDCGSFVAGKEVACAADPGRKIRLIPGFTYDLRVRGPRVPIIWDPSIVAVRVSAEQTRPVRLWSERARVSDPELEQKLDALADEFSPETLRAFDYEQPAFDPECDVLRDVMTTKGVQLMPPADAADALRPPVGVVPRNPKLPCTEYPCGFEDLPR